MGSVILCIYERCSIGGYDQFFNVFMADVQISKDFISREYRTVVVNSGLVTTDGKRASAGGVIDVCTSKVLRIHIVDAFKYFMRLVCRWK